MNWKIASIPKKSALKDRHREIMTAIAKNRGITESEWENFLSPPHPKQLSLKETGIKSKPVEKTIGLISRLKNPDVPIVVFGDYDADGITSSAILWETLTAAGIRAMPFIPSRSKHGYGLSIAGLEEVLNAYKPKLIIALDNGVTAVSETRWVQQKGVKVVIVDHHELPGETHPADALIHTTRLAAAGVTWMFTNHLAKKFDQPQISAGTLELAAIGTVADQVPLIGPNRSIVKHGIEALRRSKRVGICSLIAAAGLDQTSLSAFNIGFQLAPRLNAKGRLEEAIDSLRLLCTPNSTRASDLAKILSEANTRRQELTEQLTVAAENLVDGRNLPPAIVIADEGFHEGLIGLIAGRIVQQFWRPTIVVSRQKKFSKGSARSIPGFNIIEALRQTSGLLEGVGGHPMAAGFTIKTKNIPDFIREFNQIAAPELSPEMLTRVLKVDAKILFSDLTDEFLATLDQLHPLGVGNPAAVFVSDKVLVRQIRTVGKGNQHLKLSLGQDGNIFSAIGFNLGIKAKEIPVGSQIAVAFTPEITSWNGNSQIELKLKDIV